MNYTCTVILKKIRIEMFQVYLLLQLAFVSVLGNSVAFIDCESEYDLKTVSIEGCDDRIPCYMAIGDRLLVKLEFFADFVSHNLDQNVIFNVLHVRAKPGVTPETCGIYDCPVMTANTRNALYSVMEVPVLPLNQRGFMEWKIENEDRKTVLCYQIMIQTQTKIQKLMRDYMRKKTAPITQADQP